MKKDNLKAVLRYTKGFRLPMLVSFLLLFVELIISFVSPLIMAVTFDSVLGSNPLNTPWYFSWFINAVGGLETIKKGIWIMAAAMLGLQLVLAAISYIRAKCNNYAGEGIIKALRDRLYAHIQRLPFSYHAKAQTGDIIQRATNDIGTIRTFVIQMMLELIRTIVMIVVGIFVMFTLNVPLTLITITLVIPVVIVSIVFFNKINKLMSEQEKVEGRLFTVIQENLTGTRVVRAFSRQAHEMEKFNTENEEN